MPSIAGNHRTQSRHFLAIAVSLFLFCTSSQAQAPATGGQVTVIDQRGAEVKLTRPAQRIVTIPVPMAAMVMALDGTSRRVVGMHPAARQSIDEGFLRKVYPDALNIPADVTRGGMFTPNMEALLELKPDLVVAWSEPLEAVQTMERAGLTVLTLRNDPANLQQHFGNLEKLGQVLGLSPRVATIRADIEKKNAIVQQAMVSVTSKPRTLYLQQAKAAFRASGQNTFQNFWMTQAGGNNVAGLLMGHQTQTTLEQLIAWDPEIIFLGTFDAATPADVYANTALANVSAVRSKRVYKVPHGGYRWDPGSHESGLMLLWAASVIHPDRFKADLRSEMRSTYEAIYRHKLTDGEIDDILQVRQNALSPGYAARFSP